MFGLFGVFGEDLSGIPRFPATMPKPKTVDNSSTADAPKVTTMQESEEVVGGMDEGIKVLVVGQSRTGTMSMKVALAKLGLGPSYHMAEVMKSATAVQDVQEWQKAFEGEPADIEGILRGYKSALDYPCNELFELLMDMYPDAKVILQTRDPASWAKSVDASIGKWQYPPLLNRAWWEALPCVKYQRQLVERWGKMTRRKDGKPGVDPAFIGQWDAKVRASVPSEKLLEWNVQDGYEPLCKFLDVPIPDEPFPHINDTKELRKIHKAVTLACHVVTLGWIFGVGVGLYLVYDYYTNGERHALLGLVRRIAVTFLVLGPYTQIRSPYVLSLLMGPMMILNEYGIFIIPIVIGLIAMIVRNKEALGF